MVEITIYAIIKTQFEGIHHYPDASGDEEYLKYPHRHMFHVEVKIEQFHDDRDIEYIGFKRWVNTLFEEWEFKGNIHYLGAKSCETIAGKLMDQINYKYPGRGLTVKVLEDNENGAEVSI